MSCKFDRRFRAFGSIRYARVTMDADTGRSRGTGFASFWNLEDANKCIEEAERMRSDLDPAVSTCVTNTFSFLHFMAVYYAYYLSPHPYGRCHLILCLSPHLHVLTA